ncbi:hypothetical protein PJ311_09605 [Bacillus sp. CLL-7-23]|uniref:Sporulation protein YjcZ n=1 Tax=Bacillus changyiensis TaxID=3004103 RepID=A0ABT4X3J5_9BACI|nr:hypothetical protein [Bacillus changyiensis]MDA7026861.1 hypothetical protein [Bacillus changyiensis]
MTWSYPYYSGRAYGYAFIVVLVVVLLVVGGFYWLGPYGFLK